MKACPKFRFINSGEVTQPGDIKLPYKYAKVSDPDTTIASIGVVIHKEDCGLYLRPTSTEKGPLK